MSDQKTERLINLTLALLSSKRYLTKSEIFKKSQQLNLNPDDVLETIEHQNAESISFNDFVNQINELICPKVRLFEYCQPK